MDIVDFPIFAGLLKDSAAVERSMAFTMDEVNCTAESLTAGLHAGWYSLVCRLYDAPEGLETGVLSTGFATAVRIAAGYTSAGSVFLHAIQGYGQIQLLFDNAFHDELAGLAGAPAFGDVVIYNGESKTFTASGSEAITTVFYLRGQQVGVGSYTVHAEDLLLGGGVYRLDTIAFSLDGQRASSGTWEISHAPVSLTVNMTVPSGQGVYNQVDLQLTDLSGAIIDDETHWRSFGVAGLYDVPNLFNLVGAAAGDYLLAVRIFSGVSYGPVRFYAGELAFADVVGAAVPVTIEAGSEPEVNFFSTAP